MENISQTSTEQNMVNNAAIVEAKAQQTTTRRRRSNALPIWSVIAQARPVFNVQLEKSNSVKLKCIEKFMHAAYADSDKFWSDFMEQVNMLLDTADSGVIVKGWDANPNMWPNMSFFWEVP